MSLSSDPPFVILREAEGEVAESNIKEDNPLLWEREDRRRRWVRE